jgi:lysophospholipase L1-like esterase
MLRRLLALLVLSLSCDPSNSLTTPTDAALVAAVSEPPTIVLPTIELISHRQPRRVLVIGDSEACRVNLWIKATVHDINQRNHEPYDDVHVVCKGGTVVQYWGAGGHTRMALQEYPHPDDVVVFLGTNHYWQKTSPPTETVTDLLGDANCIWVGNTAVKGHHWPINQLIRDRVSGRCSYFDTEAANIPLDDDAHPGHAGAVKWLQMVWETIPTKYEEEANERGSVQDPDRDGSGER